MNIPGNIAKSSLLATLIFWGIGLTEGAELFAIALMFISYIPIFLSCSLVILATICPFFWLAETEKFNNKQVFRMYFPYYAIICFAICMYGIFSNTREMFSIGFFVAVFITTMQSWIWFAKETSA